MKEAARRGDAALARYGRDIDSVGAMAADGIRRNRLYIPTDRLAADALNRRTHDIIDAMPTSETTHDQALVRAMQQGEGEESRGGGG